MKLEIPEDTKSQKDYIEGYLAALRALQHDTQKMIEGAEEARESSLVIRYPGFRLEKRTSPVDYLKGYLEAINLLQKNFGRLITSGQTALQTLVDKAAK